MTIYTLNKFNENKQIIMTKDFKKLTDISELLKVEYHQIRQLYNLNKKTIKHLHPFLKALSLKYSITSDKANKDVQILDVNF